MTANEPENEKTSARKSEPFFGRNQPRNSDSNVLSVIDRDYLLNLPEDKNQRSSLSNLIYAFGAAIFIFGTLGGLTAARFAVTSSISQLQLSIIGLLTAFLTGLVFIGFGKLVELVIYRSH